jgi:hypothetical protein
MKPKLRALKDKKYASCEYFIRCIDFNEPVVQHEHKANSSIDEYWYVLWQVVRVVHIMVTKCLPTLARHYSFKVLCESAAVELSEAKEVLKRKMLEPYNEELYVSSYKESDSLNPKQHESKHSKITKVRRIGASHDRMKKMEERKMVMLQVCSQKDNFIPNVHPNVERNRKSATFWKELPAGAEFPEGWIIHIHKRRSGATGAGKNLDYYWFTNEGKKLRSRVEVKKFLATLEVANGNEDRA